MALPEVRFAIAVDTGGSVLATALAGPSKAKYLMMTGERIDASTALAWNLVDFVVEPDELQARARGIAERIAEGAPLAVQMSKQLVDNVWASAVRAALRSELMAQRCSLQRTAASCAQRRRRSALLGSPGCDTCASLLRSQLEAGRRNERMLATPLAERGKDRYNARLKLAARCCSGWKS